MAEYTSVEQEQRLLDEKDSVELYDVAIHHRTRLAGLRGFLRSPPPCVTYIFVVYAIVSIPLLTWTALCLRRLQAKPYSPVNAVLDHETQKVAADTYRIFAHEPSEDTTQLGKIFSRHELEKSNDEPDDRLVLVKTVPGGVGQGRWTKGDYLATLGVYHELHCLRRIYWNSYPVVYFNNITSELMEQERGHARHCIDTIRLSIMCTPNLGLYSFKWKGDDEKPELKSGAERTCVKWDLVQDWSNSQATGWNPLVWKPKDTTIV